MSIREFICRYCNFSKIRGFSLSHIIFYSEVTKDETTIAATLTALGLDAIKHLNSNFLHNKWRVRLSIAHAVLKGKTSAFFMCKVMLLIRFFYRYRCSVNRHCYIRLGARGLFGNRQVTSKSNKNFECRTSLSYKSPTTPRCVHSSDYV